MARPVDLTRRPATLAKAADYVLAHGLRGMSLRPLAKALGTSPRMLLYDFGTKEELVDAVLAEVRRRNAVLLDELQRGGTQRETLEAVWGWVTDEQRVPYLLLFFEIYVDALSRPEAYPDGARPLVGDWLRALDVEPEFATLMVGVVRGLLLDRLAASDPARVDRAFTLFLDLV